MIVVTLSVIEGTVRRIEYREPREGWASVHCETASDGMVECMTCHERFSSEAQFYDHRDGNACPGNPIGVSVNCNNGVSGWLS